MAFDPVAMSEPSGIGFEHLIQNSNEIDGQHGKDGLSKEYDVKGEPLPLTLPLYEGFLPGSKLIVKGAPWSENPNRFHINFECRSKDIALHLNPRFDEDEFVRNSAEKDIFYGDQEDRSGPWLFAPGEEFKLKIKCKEDEFKIKVNGNKLPSFNHRIPPDRITNLSFAGDVIFSEVTYEPTNGEDRLYSEELKVRDESLPFTLPLADGFLPGSKLTVKGTPFHDSPSRFAINFECQRQPDIALHLNPRFGEGQFVRNSANEGGWDGDEDRRGPWLFAPGEEFKMKIKCKDEEFKIKVNGEKVPSFKHRISPEEITDVLIDGDVTISKVTYEPSRESDSDSD